MKQLTVSIKQRIQLCEVLQAAIGSKLQALTARSILQTVTFSDEDIALLELSIPQLGVAHWNPKKAFDKDIELSDEQAYVLKSIFNNLDQSGKYNIDLLPLDEKINAL